MEIYFIIVGITLIISCSLSNSLRPIGLFAIQSFPVVVFLILLFNHVNAELSFILFFILYMTSAIMIKKIMET